MWCELQKCAHGASKNLLQPPSQLPVGSKPPGRNLAPFYLSQGSQTRARPQPRSTDPRRVRKRQGP